MTTCTMHKIQPAEFGLLAAVFLQFTELQSALEIV